MLRSCSKCGRVHDTSFKCNHAGLLYTNEQALRKLNKWTEKSKEIRERSLNICSVCKDKDEINFGDRLEVHHIIKLKEYPDGLLEDSNLICLCNEHHRQADGGELDIDYLRELVNKRDKDIGALL